MLILNLIVSRFKFIFLEFDALSDINLLNLLVSIPIVDNRIIKAENKRKNCKK